MAFFQWCDALSVTPGLCLDARDRNECHGHVRVTGVVCFERSPHSRFLSRILVHTAAWTCFIDAVIFRTAALHTSPIQIDSHGKRFHRKYYGSTAKQLLFFFNPIPHMMYRQ